jgi:hypothetical protein
MVVGWKKEEEKKGSATRLSQFSVGDTPISPT